MAMNPRAGRGRPNAKRSWSGPRPPSSADPRRRRAIGAKQRPDRPIVPGRGAVGTASDLSAVLDDFTESWERGERPRAERYLDLLLAEESAELIYHEYCLAEASDLAPKPADYLRRFPDHADRLSRLFALHGAVPASTLRDWAGGPADLPDVGDEIGPYRLLRELGRGAFARVFLAEQADLDHRLVVLKVSARSTAEPRLLARARHPHIVEVLRHAVADDGALHLVCMPFLGGATLASVLDVRRALGRRARSGRDLLADLDRASAPEYAPAGPGGSAREVLAGLSHPKALAWVVARLAEALDHAYRRGVAHGDLKPSNVLITAEGVPLLLDMNLATDWRDLDGDADGPTADLGGTLAYMAPERLEAIARGGEGPAARPLDRHRADIYSLGLVLLEAVTGKAPEAPRSRPKGTRELAEALAKARRVPPKALVDRGGRSIPPALRSILAKCLAADPLDRLARGNELAEDLDRWRSDRPLAFAEEPRRSVLARSARRRRSPLIAAGLTLAAAVAVWCAASMLMSGTERDRALVKYSEIPDRVDSGVFTFRRIGQWDDGPLSDPAEASARLLARYDAVDDPDWRDRADFRSLPDRERGELEALLMEQVLRHAVALRQRPESPDSWRRGLGLLDRTLARAWSAPLAVERAALLGQLKLSDTGPFPTDRPRVPRWMDQYLAGVAAEPLHAREALEHYLEALRGRPDLFWAHYRAAAVAFRVGECEVAVERLRRCVDRSPENPALRLQFASILCHAEWNTSRPRASDPLADALVECDRAVAIDPDYATAYRIRAWIRKASGWSDGVQADLDRHKMLTSRGGPAPALGLDFGLKFQPGPNFSRPPADLRSLARKVLDDAPRDHGTRTSLAAMIALDDRPAESIAELDRVLEANPGHLRARYQRGLQLARLDHAGAIAEYAALIEEPRFEELFAEDPTALRAIHHVADDLSGRGKIAEALQVAHRGLVHANRARSLGNDSLLARAKAKNQPGISPRGETHYLIARIHAAAAKTDRDHVGGVVEHLGLAFGKNQLFRDGWFAKDRQFDALRAEILERIPPVAVDR